jgi:hypothetical protein
MRHSPDFPLVFVSRLFRPGKMVLTLALLLGASQFAASVPARAQSYHDSGGNGGEHNDWAADHDEIYQVIRGDLVCNSREACGGAAAIPMNRPGWFFLPGGTRALLEQQRAAAALPARRVQLHLKNHKYRKY